MKPLSIADYLDRLGGAASEKAALYNGTAKRLYKLG